ncbi:MAG: hypothetical protein EOO71_35540 [Myxococcaceae bacterium]|nr:MAG: hypothetical protein EOO71_35540 [Myxococcaceae bacterium]
MRAAIIAGLMAVVGLAGCGGAEPIEEQDSLSTREDALPFCGNQSYWIDYYSDATLSTWVGFMACDCYETAYISGRRTQFAVTDYSSTCG